MSKDLWMQEYEDACEAFINNEDADDFTARLKRLGFDPHEIDDEIALLKGEL